MSQSVSTTFDMPTDPGKFRNVVVLGPSGSGKSTWVQALAAAADGHAPTPNKEHVRTSELTAVTIPFADLLITLLDTPGHPDFLGAVRAGLRAADGALFVVSATQGIDQSTALLWQECEVLGMPRAIVVTSCDHPSADVNETAAVVERLFTGTSHVVAQPVLDDNEELVALISLLDLRIRSYASHPPEDLGADDEHIALTANLRAALLENIITESEDEDLLDQFLAGDELAVEAVAGDLERAIARGHFHPIIPVGISSHGAVGPHDVLELIALGFPSPREHPLPTVTTLDGSPTEPLSPDSHADLCAEVIATHSDRFTGKWSMVRVFSGTLKPESVLHVSGHFSDNTGHIDHDIDERDGAVHVMLTSGDAAIASAPAGSIVRVSKLAHAETGDTLSDPRQPLLMEPWLMPEALYPIALAPLRENDDDKLASALARVLAEDPTLRLTHDDVTGQRVLWTLGEAHADFVRTRLKDRHDLETTAEELRISLRETFTEPVAAEGRNIKQSGGHGQYAVCQIRIEPLPQGSGIEFVDEVVGGAVPRHFIGSVEKGVREQLAHGVHAGYPITDVRIRLTDGKAHSVDSSDMAFATAGALAVREAAAHTALGLLEPMANVSIEVADDFVGAVLSDLSGKRGHISGTTSLDGGRTRIDAVVPELMLSRFAIDMRALTHGTGTYHREFSHFAPMPPQAAARYRAGT